MASKSKRTTFAKLNREAAVRERRQLKAAKRAARKNAAAAAPAPEWPNLEGPPADAEDEQTSPPLAGDDAQNPPSA